VGIRSKASRVGPVLALVALLGWTGGAAGEGSQPVYSALRYDSEYPVIGYSGTPTQNPVARLQERLKGGEARLQFKAPRGYLDSLLQALGIDPSSQTLVYSKSSLQIDHINAATPRAVYFNDNVYVAYVQGGMIELVTMDDSLGPVFYTLSNHQEATANLDREVLRCLACHDKFSLAGGGIPLFLVMSTLVDVNGLLLDPDTSAPTTDQTPMQDRWGGWYVSGRQGSQAHLGNILVHSKGELAHLDKVRQGNLDNLDALLDTRPYPRDTSDIVALLVFEHQTTVHNLITRVNFKARTLVARTLGSGDTSPATWAAVPSKIQPALQKIIDPLVDAMLFVDAAPFTAKITSTSGFDKWFQGQGPRDPSGRSLRELDLNTRLLRYPLSYLVYSEAFDALPGYAKDYVFGRFAAVLSGQDRSADFARLSAGDRMAITQILRSTKPEFAQVLERDGLPAIAKLN
jgi:hypothetical protein